MWKVFVVCVLKNVPSSSRMGGCCCMASGYSCDWQDRCNAGVVTKWGSCPTNSGWTDTGALCTLNADSFALSYVPKSSQSWSYTPSIKPKGSNPRGAGVSPKCTGDMVEYGSALGSCYDDCNITAHEGGYPFLQAKVNGKYPRDANGRLLRQAGKDWVNWTMQSAGLCALSCPSGYSDGGTFCSCASNPQEPKALECSGRWEQYGLECYTPCNETAGISTWDGTNNVQVKKTGYEYVAYQMQSAGLCSQKCPDGTSDGGVFCNRQKYQRPAGKPKNY